MLAKQGKLDRDIKRLETQLSEFQHKETEERRKLIDLEKTFREAQNKLRNLEQELSAINIDLTREQTPFEELKEQLPRNCRKISRKNKIGKAYGTRFGPNTKSGIFAKLKQSQAPFGAHRGIDENVISNTIPRPNDLNFVRPNGRSAKSFG